MRSWLLLALLAAPAPALAADPMASADCAADWKQKKAGGCLIADGSDKAYVHPRGWIVKKACFSDARFSADELLAAVEAAWKKFDPKTAVGAGGCLSRYNPEWGKDLVDAVWTRGMWIACPGAGSDNTCAETSHDYGRETISVRSVKGCMGKGTTGLSGVLFHESLHAAREDNFSTQTHNTAWNLPQYKFVRDRVYGAEALCFFGTAGKRDHVNILQCKEVVSHATDKDRDGLCDNFSTSFTDYPAGFWKHGGG